MGSSIHNGSMRHFFLITLIFCTLALAACAGKSGGSGDNNPEGNNPENGSPDSSSRQSGDTGPTSVGAPEPQVESSFDHPDAKNEKVGGYNATGNKNWKVLDSSVFSSLARVWGTAWNNVYAIGIDGTAVHYDGNNWSVLDLGTDTVLTDVWGSSAADVYITGFEKSFHFDGNGWSILTPPNNDGLSSVWLSAADDIYVLDVKNRIHHSTNGMQWDLVYEDTSGGTPDLYQIRGSAADNIYVAGFPSLFFDGQNWNPVDIGTVNNRAEAVWVASSNSVFLLVEDMVYYYDGNGWSSTDSGANIVLKAIWASSLSNIYIAGYGIYHFNGATWSSEIDPGTGLVYGLWGAGPTDIYAVGEAGRIIRHVPQ